MVSTHFHFNGFSPNMLYFFLVSLQALLGYPNFYYRANIHCFTNYICFYYLTDRTKKSIGLFCFSGCAYFKALSFVYAFIRGKSKPAECSAGVDLCVLGFSFFGNLVSSFSAA